MKPTTKFKSGVSLYLTIMILSLVLGLAFSLNTLLLTQTKSLRNIGNSVIAFAATETGIERALYDIKTTAGTGPWTGTLSNNAVYSVKKLNPGVNGCPSAALSYCLESIGTYKDVKRGIRIAR
ncbi:hypothetical protein L6250_00230 [Candidatus Parcubacteria bacterium]|nr:hypothetical protein [Patescibacteria group bacterium]MCG2688061.1 hypothetical protein [Candidatus Parcubacteria bacterium]